MTRTVNMRRRGRGGHAVVCLLWDGVRAALQREDMGELRSLVARLCALGVDVAVVSDHDLNAVDGALRARPDVEDRLFLFLRGGAEIYGVGPRGPHLLSKRQAEAESEPLAAVRRLLLAGRGRASSELLVVGDHGGSAALLDALRGQLSRQMTKARTAFPEPVSDRTWWFEADGFDPYREREVETLLTVANGETGTRGALEEGSVVSTPATLVAGVFGDGTGELSFRQPVPAPDWAGLQLFVGDVPLSLATGEMLEHRRVLDMRHGVLYRIWRHRDLSGHTVLVRTARFASLADREVLALRAEATAEDFSGRVFWQDAIGTSRAGGPIKTLEVQHREDAVMIVRTSGRKGGGHVMALSTRPSVGSPVVRYTDQGRDVIGGRLEAGDPATVDRLAVLVSSGTRVPLTTAATRLLTRAERCGFDELLRRHRDAWDERWRDADLVVRGDESDQEALRFAIFHMISSAHPDKDAVSVGARGLSGTSYFMHVFWDTEVFVLPFFIYTHPRTARTLLAYRYRHLDGARRKAQEMGHRGALFPWESADKGVETTPPYGHGPGGEVVPILSGIMEHHISADVAWAVWEYWKATADDVFMVAMGVEMLLETARFWVSRAMEGAECRYHIRIVVGPDEYHEAVDDNAFTNVLARWNIGKGLEAWQWLAHVDSGYAEELWTRLGLTEEELESWRAVARGLADNFDPKTLLFEQFEGFYELDDLPAERLRPRPLAADLVLGRDVTLRSKVVKQADVVMLTHLLSDEIDDGVEEANYRYYEPLTAHGSSLSPGMHAAVAARLGLMSDAVADFSMAKSIDLGDTMGNAARGLHLATMGSLWQAAVMGFAGIKRRHEALVVSPHLPPTWHEVSVPLLFRGARLRFTISRREDTLDLGISVQRVPVRVILDGVERELHPGEHLLRRGGGETWQEVEQ